MIEFNTVTKRYGRKDKHQALYNVSFHLGAGKLCFLTGHSGAGKSSLLKLIPVIDHPSSGKVLINDVDVSKLSAARIPFLRRRIGVIFQDHNLLFDRRAKDNVAMPLHIAGYNPKEINRRVSAALDKVGLLDKAKAMPASLSTGEQQRLGIARAIVGKPSILLADEPTGNLDPDLSKEVMKLFEQFQQVGVTVMIASHDINLIKQMNHPTLVLTRGKLTYNGLV